VLGYGIATMIVATGLIFFVGWRWVSRHWQAPCPSLFGWALESPLYQRLSGTRTTLERLNLRPGMRVLEIGPGPGRLLIPAAARVLPGGEAVGIDVQAGMIDRLKRRAADSGATNLTAILGDAAQPHVDAGSFDLVFLVTTLGEITDRAAALRESSRALKPGGILSVTEIFGDPHYQSRSTVRRLAAEAGLLPASDEGRWWFYTANFVKPRETAAT